MAIDAYVKFGKTDDTGGPKNTPLPDIEGDSDDADHYWWCELRDCGFDLESQEQEPDSATDDGQSGSSQSHSDDPASHFKPVRLKKRVDWASTHLFIKCCEAAEAEAKKTDSDEDSDRKGVIDEVEIHVCRPSGGEKIPFVKVWYYDVKITHFKIDISEPEPAEEIVFEFESLEYEYQPTDPYTGEKKGAARKTYALDNHEAKDPAPGAQPTAAGSAPASGGGATATVAPAASTAASGSGGSTATVVTSTESVLLANFPGAADPNGSGVLPF